MTEKIRAEKKIAAKEFMAKSGWCVGDCEARTLTRITNIVSLLEKQEYDVFFIDRAGREPYSDTMFFRPQKKGAKPNMNLLCQLVELRPDECSVDPTGMVRMWWD